MGMPDKGQEGIIIAKCFCFRSRVHCGHNQCSQAVQAETRQATLSAFSFLCPTTIILRLNFNRYPYNVFIIPFTQHDGGRRAQSKDSGPARCVRQIRQPGLLQMIYHQQVGSTIIKLLTVISKLTKPIRNLVHIHRSHFATNPSSSITSALITTHQVSSSVVAPQSNG